MERALAGVVGVDCKKQLSGIWGSVCKCMEHQKNGNIKASMCAAAGVELQLLGWQ